MVEDVEEGEGQNEDNSNSRNEEIPNEIPESRKNQNNFF